MQPIGLMIKNWAQGAGITDARKHKLSGKIFHVIELFKIS